MAFESPIYKAPSIPKISRRNISSSVIRGAEAASTATTPKLKRSSFRFLQRPKLQGTQDSLKLETNQLDALQETNRILVEIQNQLAIDFATRIAERKQAIRGIKKQTEKEKINRKEASIESIGKFNQKVGNFFDKVTAPAKSIFQKLIDFFGIIVTGIAVNTAFTWLSDEKNRQKLSDTLGFVGKYWKEIAGVLIGLQVVSTIASLVATISTVFAVLTNPAFLAAVTAVVAYKVAIDKEKSIAREREILNKKDDKSVVTPEEFKKGERPSIQQLYYEQIQRNPTGAFGIGIGNSKGGTILPISHPSFAIKSNIIKQYPNIIQRFSNGGSVGGRGSQNIDSVPARLAPGEEVIRASAANLFRPLLKDINDNAGRTWLSFSAGVTQMLENNKILKELLANLNYQLTLFKDQLDRFTSDIRYGNIKPNNANNGPVVPAPFIDNIPAMLSPGEQIMPGSAVKKLQPVLRQINVKKSKRSSKAPIVIPMTAPPIVQGGDELVQPSGGTATEEPQVGSINMMNPYMSIVPGILGIFV